MPFYALTFTRRIDYENGPSNTAFLKIIKCGHETAALAEAALRAELQIFIDQWNAYHTESGWKGETQRLREAKAARKKYAEEADEDRAFLAEGTKARADFEETTKAELDRLDQETYDCLKDKERAQEKARKALRGKTDDLPEWRKIPGFQGTLAMCDLLGDITYSAGESAISMPSFKLTHIEGALEILAKRSAITY